MKVPRVILIIRVPPLSNHLAKRVNQLQAGKMTPQWTKETRARSKKKIPPWRIHPAERIKQLRQITPMIGQSRVKHPRKISPTVPTRMRAGMTK